MSLPQSHGRAHQSVLARLVAAFILASAIASAPQVIPIASGHCPGDTGRWHASADQALPAAASAAKGVIPYVSLVTCNEPVYHSVELIRGFGWVQVGWTHTGGGPVNMYCEAQNRYDSTIHLLLEYSMSFTSHLYEYSYSDADTNWNCRLDGAVMAAIDYSVTQFGTAGEVGSQGEALGKHGQIGKNAPGAMLISGLRWRRDSNNVWSNMNLTRNTPDAPYGNAVPEAGKYQVWTNAH